eukprot:TRINITY_DN30310_c1_g1_i1.p1 TRINITY_DN30310_c1_g1~~TRINITY_DN30310_c1_g1_i1.p1  ORF type:complete len:264 (+),score=52.06 TRINITY_DN30310_c1_g1_i1:72-863(+)
MGCCLARDKEAAVELVEIDSAVRLAAPAIELDDLQAAKPETRPVALDFLDSTRWAGSDLQSLYGKFPHRLGTTAAEVQLVVADSPAPAAAPRPPARAGRHRRSGSTTQYEWSQAAQQMTDAQRPSANAVAVAPNTVGSMPSHRRRGSCLPPEMSMITQGTSLPPMPPIAIGLENRLRPIAENQSCDAGMSRDYLPQATSPSSASGPSGVTSRVDDVREDDRSLTPEVEAAILALGDKNGPKRWVYDADDDDIITVGILRPRRH